MEIEQANIMNSLAHLVGTWVGEGAGEYPTISSFFYQEQLTFSAAEGKAYLHYEQRTWRMDEIDQKTQSHWETGFFRVLPNNEIELLCVQASGRVEIARGRLASKQGGFTLSMQSHQFANDARVERTWRDFELRGNILQYSLKMQTTEVTALTLHVKAQLIHNA